MIFNYPQTFKRIIDLVVSIIALILLSPVMLLTFLLVKKLLGSPVIYAQFRPGLNEKTFRLYKFRTMTNEKDQLGNLLPDERRLTRFGKFLRSTSIDELPEFINILRGEMSLVGPRPLLVEYLPLYNEIQKKRHLVRPGLTGWAQVKGRNSLTWEEKFNLDVWYTENLTFTLDVKIIVLTVSTVLSRKGIASSTSETMEVFKGNM